MGDLTRSIVNRANVPVLVARAGKSDRAELPGFWRALKSIFFPSRGPQRAELAAAIRSARGLALAATDSGCHVGRLKFAPK